MMKHPSFSCSKCGSRNTVLRDRPPTGWLDGLKNWLLSASQLSGNGFPMGRKFVVCKDCGHVSCIHIL